MNELDDEKLLADYVQAASEEAFAALVSRYINLVYSAGLRFTSNSHHAEEIAQAVFIILASKAGGLRRGTVLSGWLYQTARLVAANFVKAETRRQRREQEAYMQTTTPESESSVWTQIAPLLDDALGQLGDNDRKAIVLRYFEKKSDKEVAARLWVTEDAAQRRITRAVEKLRKIFNRRGVTLTVALIAGAITANSMKAAPAGLGAILARAALAKGAAAGVPASTLAKATLKGMAWAKIKAGAAIGFAALTVTMAILFIAPMKPPGSPAAPAGNAQAPANPATPAHDNSATYKYSLTELGTIPGFASSHFTALNNRGQVVGGATSTNLESHAFLWNHGAMTDLGTLGGAKSLATGINDAGDIVGSILTNGERHAFLLRNGEFSDLGVIDNFAKLGGEGNTFYAPQIKINNQAQVTGHLTVANLDSRSFLLDQGRTAYFGLLSNSTIFYAEAINNRGEILGRATPVHGSTRMRSMLWQDGKAIDLGDLNGMQSTAADLNDHGIVVGSVALTNQASSGKQSFQAFLWEKGRMRLLGSSNNKTSVAVAVNNMEQVVGWAQTDKGRYYACIWNDGEMMNLNDLVAMEPGWNLVSAEAINDRGQIVAQAVKGKQRRIYVLSPLNLPAQIPAQPIVTSPPPERPLVQITPFNLVSFDALPGGAFRLRFVGDPNARYGIEASTNLVTWTPLGPVTNQGGYMEFIDADATNFMIRFYRAVPLH